MKRLQRKFWLETIVWVVAEILLNQLGLDNLADYGEFVFNQTLSAYNLAQPTQIVYLIKG
jgi:hypothetical protein